MNRKEYNKCVEEYSDAVYRFMLKNTRHVEDSKDIVQEAFTRLWQNHEGIESSKAKSYLFRVAYNYMIDRIRKVKFMNASVEVESLDRSNITEDKFDNKQLIGLASVARKSLIRHSEKSLSMIHDPLY